MATGDLKNNIRKLQSALKHIKYMGDVDLTGIAEGKPEAFLPIYHFTTYSHSLTARPSVAEGKPEAFLPLYHYTFTTYSHTLTAQLTDAGISLTGKSDKKFMTELYQILRTMFDYKPTITKDQFFSSSFAERKIIMAAEVIELVHKQHSSQNPRKSSAYRNVMAKGTLPDYKGIPWQPKGKFAPKTEQHYSFAPVPRKIASSSRPDVIPNVKTDITSHIIRDRSSSLPPHGSSHVSHSPHDTTHDIHHSQTFVPHDQTHIPIAHGTHPAHNTTHAMSHMPMSPPPIPSHLLDHSHDPDHVLDSSAVSFDDEVDLDETAEPIDIIAMSPAITRHPPSDMSPILDNHLPHTNYPPSTVTYPPSATYPPSSPLVTRHDTSAIAEDVAMLRNGVIGNTQAIGTLTETVTNIARQVASSDTTSQSPSPDAELQECLTNILHKLENLTARMVLVEHRTVLMDAKIAHLPNPGSKHPTAYQRNGFDEERNGDAFYPSHTSHSVSAVVSASTPSVEHSTHIPNLDLNATKEDRIPPTENSPVVVDRAMEQPLTQTVEQPVVEHKSKPETIHERCERMDREMEELRGSLLKKDTSLESGNSLGKENTAPTFQNDYGNGDGSEDIHRNSSTMKYEVFYSDEKN